MNKKIMIKGISALMLSIIFYFISAINNFIFFYHSQPSDLMGLFLTLLFLIFYIFAIYYSKQIKTAQWILLILSIFSIISIVLIWVAYFNGTNPIVAILTFIVVIVITPFYGISFWFGTESMRSLPFLIILSCIVILLLLLKLNIFFKNRRHKYEKT